MAVKGFRFILLLVLPVVLAGPLAVATENYCKDPQSWDEWETLVRKYPNDLDLQALHALRLGLCIKVERGDLTVGEGTDIFERAREAILEKKKSETGKSEKLDLQQTIDFQFPISKKADDGKCEVRYHIETSGEDKVVEVRILPDLYFVFPLCY